LTKPNVTKRKRSKKPAKKKKAAKKPKKMGRPRKEIDLDTMQKLRELQCTDDELAAFFGVCVNTIYERKKEPDFLEAYKKGPELGKLSLRRTLWLNAQRHPATAIFLSKNLLGYQDNPEAQRMVDTPERFVPMPDGTFKRIAEGDSQIGQFDESVDTPKS